MSTGIGYEDRLEQNLSANRTARSLSLWICFPLFHNGASAINPRLRIRLYTRRFEHSRARPFQSRESSFLNHFVGRELLPVGVIPVTSVVTEMAWAPEERAAIHFLRWPHGSPKS